MTTWLLHWAGERQRQRAPAPTRVAVTGRGQATVLRWPPCHLEARAWVSWRLRVRFGRSHFARRPLSTPKWLRRSSLPGSRGPGGGALLQHGCVRSPPLMDAGGRGVALTCGTCGATLRGACAVPSEEAEQADDNDSPRLDYGGPLGPSSFSWAPCCASRIGLAAASRTIGNPEKSAITGFRPATVGPQRPPATASLRLCCRSSQLLTCERQQL